MPPKKNKSGSAQQDVFAGPAGAFTGLIVLGAVTDALKRADNNVPPEDQYLSKRRNAYNNKALRQASKRINKDDGDDLASGRYIEKDGELVRAGKTKVLNRYHGTPQSDGNVISKFKLKPTGFEGRKALNSLPTLYTTRDRSVAEHYAYGASANTPDDTGNKQHQVYSLGLTPSEIVDLGDCENNKNVRKAHRLGADVIECDDFEEVPETVVFNDNIVYIKDVKDADTGQSIPEDVYLTETGNPGPMARRAISNQSTKGLNNVAYLAINHDTPEEVRAVIFADGSVAYERGPNRELWEGTPKLEQEFIRYYEGINDIGPRSSYNNENLLLEEFERRTRESTIDEEQARRAMRRREGYYDRLRAEAAARTTPEEKQEYEAMKNELQELSDRLKRNAQKAEEDEYRQKNDIYFNNPDRMGRDAPEDIYLSQTGEPSVLTKSILDHYYDTSYESFSQIIKQYNYKQNTVVTNNHDNDTIAYLLNDGGIIYYDRADKEPWVGNEDLEQQAAEEFRYDGYVVGPDASIVRERAKIEIPEETRGLSSTQRRAIQRERRRVGDTPPEDQYLALRRPEQAEQYVPNYILSGINRDKQYHESVLQRTQGDVVRSLDRIGSANYVLRANRDLENITEREQNDEPYIDLIENNSESAYSNLKLLEYITPDDDDSGKEFIKENYEKLNDLRYADKSGGLIREILSDNREEDNIITAESISENIDREQYGESTRGLSRSQRRLLQRERAREARLDLPEDQYFANDDDFDDYDDDNEHVREIRRREQEILNAPTDYYPVPKDNIKDYSDEELKENISYEMRNIEHLTSELSKGRQDGYSNSDEIMQRLYRRLEESKDNLTKQYIELEENRKALEKLEKRFDYRMKYHRSISGMDIAPEDQYFVTRSDDDSYSEASMMDSQESFVSEVQSIKSEIKNITNDVENNIGNYSSEQITELSRNRENKLKELNYLIRLRNSEISNESTQADSFENIILGMIKPIEYERFGERYEENIVDKVNLRDKPYKSSIYQFVDNSLLYVQEKDDVVNAYSIKSDDESEFIDNLLDDVNETSDTQTYFQNKDILDRIDRVYNSRIENDDVVDFSTVTRTTRELSPEGRQVEQQIRSQRDRLYGSEYEDDYNDVDLDAGDVFETDDEQYDYIDSPEPLDIDDTAFTQSRPKLPSEDTVEERIEFLQETLNDMSIRLEQERASDDPDRIFISGLQREQELISNKIKDLLKSSDDSEVFSAPIRETDPLAIKSLTDEQLSDKQKEIALQIGDQKGLLYDIERNEPNVVLDENHPQVEKLFALEELANVYVDEHFARQTEETRSKRSEEFSALDFGGDKPEEAEVYLQTNDIPDAISTRGMSRSERRVLQRERMRQLRADTPPEDQYFNGDDDEDDGEDYDYKFISNDRLRERIKNFENEYEYLDSQHERTGDEYYANEAQGIKRELETLKKEAEERIRDGRDHVSYFNIDDTVANLNNDILDAEIKKFANEVHDNEIKLKAIEQTYMSYLDSDDIIEISEKGDVDLESIPDYLDKKGINHNTLIREKSQADREISYANRILEKLVSEYTDRQEKGLIVEDKKDEYIETSDDVEIPSIKETRGQTRDQRRALQRERMRKNRFDSDMAAPEDQYLNSDYKERDGDNVYSLIGIRPQSYDNVDVLVEEMSGQSGNDYDDKKYTVANNKNKARSKQRNRRNNDNDYIMSDVARTRLSRKMTTSQRTQDTINRQRIVNESNGSRSANNLFGRKPSKQYYDNENLSIINKDNTDNKTDNAILSRGVAAQARMSIRQ